MNFFQRLAAVLALAAVSATAQAQIAEKKVLTLDGAKRVLAAAEAEAKKLNAPGAAIAVVDDGGNLMAVARLDNTFAAGANISIGKARTAAIFKRPTSVFEDIITKNGRTSMVALNDFTPLQGGVPILAGGQILGAVGVSGAASADQDTQIAVAAANTFANQSMDMPETSGSITYLDSRTVADAFQKGQPLLEVNNYKIHASRREAAGMAELHEKDTDIIYVLEGTATFVTGGTVVDGKTTAADEIRGASIQDGQTRQIKKGDVIVVPNGTPHWFKEVKGVFLYYVVKVS